MTDEKYLFVKTSIDTKRTARGAHNRCTHGGRMKTPSDYLSKKEIKKMSGEVKSYRLNEPMTWAEFLEMPEDLQFDYIFAIRLKYGASDSQIFKMLGVEQRKGAYEFAKLKIARGRNAERLKFNKDAWEKWLAGIKEPCEAFDNSVNERILAEVEEPAADAVPVVATLPTSKRRIYPMRGHMTLRGNAEEIAQVIVEMLGAENMTVDFSWVVEA